MKSKNAENYENVIIRNNKEIGINNYGLDYLVSLEQKIDNAIEYIKKLKNFKIKCVVLEEKELYASENDFVKELLEILKENNNEE